MMKGLSRITVVFVSALLTVPLACGDTLGLNTNGIAVTATDPVLSPLGANLIGLGSPVRESESTYYGNFGGSTTISGAGGSVVPSAPTGTSVGGTFPGGISPAWISAGRTSPGSISSRGTSPGGTSSGETSRGETSRDGTSPDGTSSDGTSPGGDGPLIAALDPANLSLSGAQGSNVLGTSVNGDPSVQTQEAAIPEPSTIALLSIGLLGLITHRLRQQRT